MLNEDFTFARYVVGAHNALACAAAKQVAQAPGMTAYNPLFLYGGAGLGKTHLLQAIGHSIMEQAPNLRVVYAPAEVFTNELITAILRSRDHAAAMQRFQHKYRTADVFLIDDLSFVSGKEATQQELFHTFNILFDAHKQIVITCDRSPKELTLLDERYRSRCAMGLQADIKAPDYESRMAILRDLNSQAKQLLTEDILSYIAGNITDNVCVLLGAYKKVQAMHLLLGTPVSLQMAKHCLQDVISPLQPA